MHYAKAAEKIVEEYEDNFPSMETATLCSHILKQVKATKFMVLKRAGGLKLQDYHKSLSAVREEFDEGGLAQALHEVDKEFLKSLTMSDFFR